jgi:hypothetical protein
MPHHPHALQSGICPHNTRAICFTNGGSSRLSFVLLNVPRDDDIGRAVLAAAARQRAHTPMCATGACCVHSHNRLGLLLFPCHPCSVQTQRQALQLPCWRSAAAAAGLRGGVRDVLRRGACACASLMFQLLLQATGAAGLAGGRCYALRGVPSSWLWMLAASSAPCHSCARHPVAVLRPALPRHACTQPDTHPHPPSHRPAVLLGSTVGARGSFTTFVLVTCTQARSPRSQIARGELSGTPARARRGWGSRAGNRLCAQQTTRPGAPCVDWSAPGARFGPVYAQLRPHPELVARLVRELTAWHEQSTVATDRSCGRWCGAADTCALK